MWVVSFALGLRLKLSNEKNTSVAFTARSYNFELAIAVAIGVFGVTSGEALAGVVGPLIEVPVLVGLVTWRCGLAGGSIRPAESGWNRVPDCAGGRRVIPP